MAYWSAVAPKTAVSWTAATAATGSWSAVAGDTETGGDWTEFRDHEFPIVFGDDGLVTGRIWQRTSERDG